MTRDEIKTRVLQLLHFRSGNTRDTSVVENAIQQAQRMLELEEFYPPFLLVEDAVLLGVGDDPDVTLPNDFRLESEEEGLRALNEDSEEVPLLKGDLRALTNTWRESGGLESSSADDTIEMPTAYALRGGGSSQSIRVFPTPTAAWTMLLSYYARQDELTLGVDTNAWSEHAPDLLIGIAGQICAVALLDSDAIPVFKGIEAAAKGALERQLLNRQVGGDRAYFMNSEL